MGVEGLNGLVNVYRPNSVTERKETWENFHNLISKEEIKWVLFGDFNEVKKAEEQLNSILIQKGMDDFNEFIDN